MAITSAICNSFKTEILQGGHNLNTSGATPAGNAFKLALFTSSATLSKSTTVYTAPADGGADPTNTNEVSTASSSNYPTGGNALTVTANPTLSTDTACVKFDNSSFSNATFTARGCLIYNTTAISGFTTNRSVCVVNFGADKTVTSGTFTIEFPAQTAGNAIIQIA